ncbi:hypothetical protein [Scytonema sp. NUACC26]|uniref:hypothetical protein n=1 Tax=Scytonema sp. NUACC26 TaxID=3140176 RepID=UPI0034DC9611
MKVDNQGLYYKATSQIHENIEEVFAQNAGFTASTKRKKPTLVARWYRENGKMVCHWETL